MFGPQFQNWLMQNKDLVNGGNHVSSYGQPPGHSIEQVQALYDQFKLQQMINAGNGGGNGGGGNQRPPNASGQATSGVYSRPPIMPPGWTPPRPTSLPTQPPGTTKPGAANSFPHLKFMGMGGL